MNHPYQVKGIAALGEIEESDRPAWTIRSTAAEEEYIMTSLALKFAQRTNKAGHPTIVKKHLFNMKYPHRAVSSLKVSAG